MPTYNSTINVSRLSVAVFATILGITVYLFPKVQTLYAGDNLWTPTGPYGVMVRSLAIAPTNNQVIYAGTDGSQTSVFKSVDGGTTWSPRNNGIPAGTSYGFAFDPNNPDLVYVATSTGFYRSTDAGGTWILKSNTQISGTEYTLIPWGIASSAVDGTLYLATGFWGGIDGLSGIYRSTDHGETWEFIFSTFRPTAIAIAPSAPHIIYVGSMLGGGIFKSTDGGSTWQEIDSSFGTLPSVISMVVDIHDAQVVYLGLAQNGIFKTINGGQTWTPIGTGLGSINVDDIKIDPRNQQVMYVGGGDIGLSSTTSFGVFRSLDNAGLSWAAMNAGMGSRSVYSLAIDDGSPQSIYAGTPNGVWKYTVASGHTDYSVSINNGALFSNQTAVNLTLTAPPLTDQMIISNDGGFGGATWEPFAAQKPWTITLYGNYVIPRTVYAKFRTTGQTSGQYQDDIILDQTPPTGTLQITNALSGLVPSHLSAVRATTDTLTNTVYLPIVGKGFRPGMRLVVLILSATDDISGVGSMLVSNDGNFTGAPWQVYSTGLDWWVLDKGTTTVYVKYRDRANNESQVYSAATTAP
jgi:photosystem II stability/assembly factor-like uncharacterized protein